MQVETFHHPGCSLIGLLLFLVFMVVMIRLAFSLVANVVNFFWHAIVEVPAKAQVKPSVAAALSLVGARACRNVRCQAPNPPGARFCRRCGQKL
jgi:hypothetical protein